jgi:hypothetical protein
VDYIIVWLFFRSEKTRSGVPPPIILLLLLPCKKNCRSKNVEVIFNHHDGIGNSPISFSRCAYSHPAQTVFTALSVSCEQFFVPSDPHRDLFLLSVESAIPPLLPKRSA